MPCYRCGARQSDPEQGKTSPWRRGVRREHQVLVCPDCFGDATGELDRCPGCDGTQLIRRLDQIECLSCGRSREVNEESAAGENPVPESRAPVPGSPASGSLAAEVASALDRVLGR